MTEAVNHITESGAHEELLQRLTDDQLDEQMEYYRREYEDADTERGKWGWSKLLSTAYTVKQTRTAIHPEPQ